MLAPVPYDFDPCYPAHALPATAMRGWPPYDPVAAPSQVLDPLVSSPFVPPPLPPSPAPPLGLERPLPEPPNTDEAAADAQWSPLVSMAPLPFFGCSEVSPSAYSYPAFAEFTPPIQTMRVAQRACDARNWARWFVTFWFSLENLAHDWFLRAKLGADGRSFVDVDLIAGFPRMRALQMPLDRLVDILRGIETLEVSRDGRHVRRRDAIAPGCMDGDATSSC